AELGRRVVVEPEGHAEAVPQRRGQEPGAGSRADERERGQIERERACGCALPDDYVEPEVLERRIEDLLDRAVQTMDLVHEQDVVPLESREDRRHVTLALQRRSGDAADADTELLAQDVGETRL